MNEEVVVIETIKAVLGKKDELKRALIELVSISRKAPGCLQYDLLESIDVGDQFLIMMRWEKLADLRRHETSDYIEAFEQKYDKVLYDEVKVAEWNPLAI